MRVHSKFVMCVFAVVVSGDWNRVQAGAESHFAEAIRRDFNGKSVALSLTGAAYREKFLLTIYAIGSYVAKDVEVKTAEQLAAADCHKCLQLQLQRDVSGKDMATNVRNSIQANYPTQFDDELRVLTNYMNANPVRRGDHVWLTHTPGVGFSCTITGKAPIAIKNPAFSRAVWDIYLGRRNLGAGIKSGLVGRL